MPNKGGGGYGGGPYYQGGSGTNDNSNIPIAEATPVAEAIPVSAASAGGSYAPPTYDGTYTRPPPVSPYSSSITEPSSSYQQQQQQQHPPGIPAPVPPDRPPLPLEPYPGAGAAYGAQHQHQQRLPHQHQQQYRPGAAGPGMPGTGPTVVMGQPVQGGQGGQPMTGEQLVLVQVNPRQPFPCQCPHCAAHVTTELSFVSNGFTFLGCLGLALLGCYPCCLIPFCVPDCKSAVHVCPRCRGVIAVA